MTPVPLFSPSVVQRFKFVKGKGAKWVVKKIPFVGFGASVFFYSEDVQAKGTGGGTMNSAADAIPGISTLKGVVEVVIGQDIIPDLTEDDRKVMETQEALKQAAQKELELLLELEKKFPKSKKTCHFGPSNAMSLEQLKKLLDDN